MKLASAELALRRDAPADPRAQQIVAAAYDLLAEEGLEGLTIRAVLARTGLARRAFYDNFGGKDDLVLAVFAQTLHAAARQLGEWANAAETPLERLRYIVSSIVMGKFGRDETPEGARDLRGAALSREHMRLAESHPEELQAALRPLLGVISGYLSQGMADGSVRKADPGRLALLVYNLVSTTVHTELLAEESGIPDMARRAALADELWDFCRRAVIA
ncbi:MAG: TetR/AcrR family transcriptional regulator [Novosphingobium sp.]